MTSPNEDETDNSWAARLYGELLTTIVELRKENHELRRSLNRAKLFEMAFREQRRVQPSLRQVLVELSWAEDMDEVRKVVEKYEKWNEQDPPG